MFSRTAAAVVLSLFFTSGSPSWDHEGQFKLQVPAGVKAPSEKPSRPAYIPKDLDDCIAQLEKMLAKADREKIKAGPEKEVNRYYFDFGAVGYGLDRYVLEQWLEKDPLLLKWFEKQQGDRGRNDLTDLDPDDMADIILRCFWRHLNAKPIDLPGQIKKHRIYIPKDLDDCFVQLKTILSKQLVEEMKGGSDKDMSRYHHGLGRWMRNNWYLWRGSRLSKWFNERGIQHPDDMSGIILRCFWRHLNSQPPRLEEQIKYYQDYWKKAREEEAKEKAKMPATKE